uniref:Uncharacterized protein n=1 Tax=Aegilops tauschii TaxID=37682 RepID=R7WB32_AEGTA
MPSPAAAGSSEAPVLQELGLAGAVPVARRSSPPLAVAGDDRRLPFESSSVHFVSTGHALDSSKRPSNLAGEAAPIFKPEVHLVMLTSNAGDAYSLRSLQALCPSLRLFVN